MLALFGADDGREELQAGALREGEQLIDHLIDGLLGNDAAALGAMGGTHAGVEQAQVIVDFGDGADGGAGVFAGGFLVDGDGGGEAVDGIDVGLFHLPEELARIGRKALDIAALALGVEGIEGEGGLAAAGEAGEDDEFIAREGQVEVFEVILSDAADDDVFLHEKLLKGQRKSVFISTRSEEKNVPKWVLGRQPYYNP